DPARNGFAYAYGYPDMVHAHNFYPEFLVQNGERVALAGNRARGDIDWSQHYYKAQPLGGGVAAEKVTYAVDEFDREALDFLERNQDTSFFLYLALNTPHANNEAGRYEGDGMEVQTALVEDERVYQYGAFAGKDWPDPEKGFATMVTNLDNTVNRLREKLQQLNLAGNTYIFFTSDNGPHQEGEHKVDFFDSNGPLRGRKRDLYEGGIRVPLLVVGPDVAPGRVSEPFAFWDVLPTFCEIADRPVPNGIDGVSFYPSLTSRAEEQEQHTSIYFEFYEQGGKQSVRRGKWKLVKLNLRNEAPVITELYDLEKDLGETTDLAEQHPKIVKELEAILREEHEPVSRISLFN
ncbi:MAG: sulfatase-like hydrolase/transferase, partial [Bacteroidota bacterium]